RRLVGRGRHAPRGAAAGRPARNPAPGRAAGRPPPRPGRAVHRAPPALRDPGRRLGAAPPAPRAGRQRAEVARSSRGRERAGGASRSLTPAAPTRKTRSTYLSRTARLPAACGATALPRNFASPAFLPRDDDSVT